uniref:L-Fucosyltransferase n=1 Tax=Haemonchus contortus TaxID=6289 RepID=A0A7I4Y1Y5_HAECO
MVEHILNRSEPYEGTNLESHPVDAQKPMSPCWRRSFKWIIFLQCCLMIWLHWWLMSSTAEKSGKVGGIGEGGTKFVGLHLNGGRMGNQLFHLITGYAIAKTIGRVHYLPHEDECRGTVLKYLELFKQVFPALERTYYLEKDRINGTLVPFAKKSCCVYDDPRRLMNHPDKFLLLDFSFAQNPRYFEDMIDEIRELLEFSPNITSEGGFLLDSLKANYSSKEGEFSFWDRPNQSALCIHIRRTDFLERNISTNMMETVTAANDIARGKGVDRFLIFGDDKDFMYNLTKVIIRTGNWNRNAAYVSQFSEAIDFYVASQVCRSFLITAVTSSFGWWLAFFVADQNSIYYMPDDRIHGDKVPSKELFLKSWQKYIP